MKDSQLLNGIEPYLQLGKQTQKPVNTAIIFQNDISFVGARRVLGSNYSLEKIEHFDVLA